jgi:hypothetical protein
MSRSIQSVVCAAQVALAFGLALCLVPPARATSPVEAMLELSLQGRKIEGSPISWSESVVHLLGRDGRLWEIDPDAVKDYKKSGDHFRAYSPSDIRARLLGELGEEYEVSGTSHYLVAHPKGQSDKWAERFEQLYRSFTSYFALRGFRSTPPPFPLIGVVCRNQREFQRYSARNGVAARPGVLGFYSLDSNRIILYDIAAPANSTNWQDNASVIIHEAAHQTAFNTGLHSRFCPPPAWLAEGLATMFEAPGLYDAHQRPHLADRINRGRLNEFRSLVEARHRPELLSSMIASDRLFNTNPTTAYAEAWAFTFFLVESQPRKYAQYLALTASRPPFAACGAQDRIADFTRIFGANWKMLEAQFLRFMKGVN